MQILQKSLIAIPAILLFVSCGSQKPMVKDIEVTPHYVNNDLHVSLSADLGLGNVALPQISLPIVKNGEDIGTVSMGSLMGGENALEVSINVNAVADIQTELARLPNGAALPLIGGNRAIVVPISSKMELYLSIEDGSAAIGISIPFKTLDSIGAKVGNSSVFPAFHMNEVSGAAGMYFSKTRGQNGFGLFADISQVLDQTMFKHLGFRPDIQAQSSLEFASIRPSSRTKRKIDRQLYYLNRKRARLQLH